MKHWLWIPLILAMGLSAQDRSAQEMPLSLAEAVSRGVRTNIAVLVNETSRDVALAADKRALSDLLPNLSINAYESAQQRNLAAFGFTGFSAFPGFKSVVGPFALFDARANLSMPILDLSSRLTRQATTANLDNTRDVIEDARDTVASAVANLYFQAVALESRLRTAEAQRTTAEQLYQQAQDQKSAGVVAGIAVVRAQVQLRIDEQRVIAARNDWAKQKLRLANAIGLPLSQAIRLTDTQMAETAVDLSSEQALQEAMQMRPDYRAYASRIKSAELRVQAARAQRLPTASVQSDYGVIGKNITSTHGTFSVTAGVRMPLFEGGRIEADVQQADAQLREQRARQNDLASQIDLQVRSALLDVESASQRTATAKVATGLADLQLEQARDRFAAGVTDNLEVVQSQDAVAVAQDNYISALFELQLAKSALARAIGQTERNLQRFLTQATPQGRTN